MHQLHAMHEAYMQVLQGCILAMELPSYHSDYCNIVLSVWCARCG